MRVLFQFIAEVRVPVDEHGVKHRRAYSAVPPGVSKDVQSSIKLGFVSLVLYYSVKINKRIYLISPFHFRPSATPAVSSGKAGTKLRKVKHCDLDVQKLPNKSLSRTGFLLWIFWAFFVIRDIVLSNHAGVFRLARAPQP